MRRPIALIVSAAAVAVLAGGAAYAASAPVLNRPAEPEHQVAETHEATTEAPSTTVSTPVSPPTDPAPNDDPAGHEAVDTDHGHDATGSETESPEAEAHRSANATDPDTVNARGAAHEANEATEQEREHAPEVEHETERHGSASVPTSEVHRGGEDRPAPSVPTTVSHSGHGGDDQVTPATPVTPATTGPAAGGTDVRHGGESGGHR